ncbi:MAG: transglutaminase domain-containing protein, partial [Desulfuromonadales bacterium]
MGRTLHGVLCALLVALGGVTGPALAAEGTPEQSVWSAAEHARQIVERMLADELRSRVNAADVHGLQELHETIAAGHLLLTERLRLRGDALQGGDGQGGERHRAAAARYEIAVSRVLAGLARVTALPARDAAALEALHAALVELAPPRRPAIHGSLPYHQPAFLPGPPVALPQMIPAYRMAEPAPSTAADLAGTPEAPLSLLITTQAGSIAAASGRTHRDPAAIYNWVRENIRTEWYWGSMKGAEETLRQKSGNDADQAALLIALLRASGYPARYVRGVAEFFPGLEAARSATGISDPEQLPVFFQAAGIPCEVVREGSRLVNLRLEHFWVEALVPYANYRGMEADTTGKLWIPLDTSLKTGGF